MTALEGRIDDIHGLTASDRDELFTLMSRHYARVCRAVFEADLREKQWVIRLVDAASGALYGFSTQMLLAARVGDRPVRALFSGDTIVDRLHWGTPELALAWGRLAFSVIQQHPTEELYWFLISQGYRTYRFLPVYFREFYPRWDIPTPDEIRAVMDALGTAKFAASYDARAGIVRGSQHSYLLRPGLAELTAERLKDPHVEFFVTHNPGHVHGDELCCLAPLTRENFSPVARRLIRSPRFAGSTVS